jgi:protein phosphatase
MDAFGQTDVGVARNHNEDAIYVSVGPVGALPNLFIVSDGMGGHNAGEIASSKAIGIFCEIVRQRVPEGKTHEFLRDATVLANNSVYKISMQDASLSGMGATFTAASISGRAVSVSHIGDSRLYFASPAGLEQLTVDHSYVHDLVKLGIITELEALTHPKKNLLTRALGVVLDEKVDSFEYEAPSDGLLLLCSDGLTNMLGEAEILETILGPGTLEERVGGLVASANKHGGRDNISAVLVDLKR